MGSKRPAAAVVLVAALLSGCVAPAYMVYKQANIYEAEYPHPYELVYDATLTTLTEMNAAVEDASEGAGGALIEARGPEGKKIAVNMDVVTPKPTKVRVQVGTLGDKKAAQAIAGEIGQRLGEPQETGRGGERRSW